MPAIVFSFETAHEYSDVLPQMLRLRNKEFVVRQEYDVPQFKDMEYDEFDTLAAVYVVYIDNDNIVRGCSRMSPTSKPYMIQKIFPDILGDIPLPQSDSIWESSRFCVDSTLPANMRHEVKLAILQTKIEYCLAIKMDGLIGIMSPLIWRAVFVNSGWEIKHLGQLKKLENGEKIVSAWIPVNNQVLSNIQSKRSANNYMLQNIRGIEHLLVRETRNTPYKSIKMAA